jgi:Ca2+-binding EF-hand superfamily protein
MEISSFLDRKLSRRFRAYDDDGNGLLDRSDFERPVARVAEEFGEGPGSPARQRLLELSLGLWEHLVKVSDKDADGRISEGEYKAAFAAGLLVTPEAFDQGYVPFCNAVMDIADQDRDGKLTMSDHVRWISTMLRQPEADAREAFRRMDRDGNGFITVRDLVETIRGYYFDESADSPGHWLLGSLDP